jgi:hypothetical protein
MVSHGKLGDIKISLGKGGLRLKKKPSQFNICIGKALKGGEGPTHGGRYDKGWQAKFTAANHACGGRKMKKVM